MMILAIALYIIGFINQLILWFEEQYRPFCLGDWLLLFAACLLWPFGPLIFAVDFLSRHRDFFRF